MKTYDVKFLAKKIGSIGKRVSFSELIDAKNPEQAKLKLYDRHEHITIRSITEVQP